MHSVAFPLAMMACCALAPTIAPATNAAALEIQFSGTLNLYPNQTTTNFLSAQVGERVSGRFLVDTGVTVNNTGGTNAIQYTAGILPGRELKFVSTEFQGSTFDFTRADQQGSDKDRLRLGPGTNPARQQLSISDVYRDGAGSGVCGAATNLRYCWTVELSALLPGGTLPLEWPQTFTLGPDQLTEAELRFNLFNDMAEFGPLGRMSGYLSLDTLNATAPVPTPLPAAAWLFLTGLGGLVWMRRARR